MIKNIIITKSSFLEKTNKKKGCHDITDKHVCNTFSGFRYTLIELLVIISIIAILASLLLPLLTKARSVGKRTLCVSNQGNLSKINTIYAADHRGSLIPLQGARYDLEESEESKIYRNFWSGIDESTSQNFGNAWKLGYFETGEILYCPLHDDGWDYKTYSSLSSSSFPEPSSPPGTGWANGVRVSYCYNPCRVDYDVNQDVARYKTLADYDSDCIMTIDMITEMWNPLVYARWRPHKNLPSVTFSKGDGSVVTNSNPSDISRIYEQSFESKQAIYETLQMLTEL